MCKVLLISSVLSLLHQRNFVSLASTLDFPSTVPSKKMHRQSACWLTPAGRVFGCEGLSLNYVTLRGLGSGFSVRLPFRRKIRRLPKSDVRFFGSYRSVLTNGPWLWFEIVGKRIESKLAVYTYGGFLFTVFHYS